jgi:tyrosinase
MAFAPRIRLYASEGDRSMLSRRAFLAGLSAFSFAGSRVTVSAQGAGVRRSVRGMTANDADLAAYARAVAAMKALPPSDPRNWNRFAALHGQFCPHGNWYFLPWHRAYLAALEGVCRELSGKPDFALPYWDWSVDRQIPAAFTAGTPQTNALNHRRSGSLAITDDMTGPAVISRIMNSPDFEAFGSTRPRGQNDTSARWQRRMGAKTELEFNPHDGVHQAVGGDMAQVAVASRDPLFYLHHANVDRLWSAWNARGNENSSDALWRGFAFVRNFPRAGGRGTWDVSVSDLLSTDQLGYRYDNGRGPFAADVDVDAFTARSARARSWTAHLEAYRRFDTDTLPRSMRGAQRIALAGGGGWHIACAETTEAASQDRPVSIPISFGRPIGDYIKPDALSSARLYTAGTDERQCVWAVLRDIEPPKEPVTRVRVYINRDGLSPNVRPDDPHYVTSLSFFGAEHATHAASSAHAHHAAASAGSTPVTGGAVCVDLSAALARLSGSRHFRSDRLVLQLQPVCPSGDAASSTVRARRVEVVVL